MDNDPLCYDVWIEQALRGVVRRALSHAADYGLTGDHHFYITFATDAPGVSIPGYLQAEHPNEMTIVLQHQFSDLAVDEESFSVTLSFRGKAEHLKIPLEAVTSLADPSVNFGLQLKMMQISDEPDAKEVEGEAESPETAADGDPRTAEVVTLDSFRRK